MASADAPGVRRTQSTGDINDTVARPEPARLPHGHRRSTTVSPHDSQVIIDGFSRLSHSLPAPVPTSASIPAAARSPTPSAPQAAQDPDNELHIRLDGLSPEDIATMRRAVDTLAQMRETTDMETLTRALETIQEIRERGDRHRRERAQPWPRRLLKFLGYGRRNKERKELVTVVFNTSFAIVQVSPTRPAPSFPSYALLPHGSLWSLLLFSPTPTTYGAQLIRRRTNGMPAVDPWAYGMRFG